MNGQLPLALECLEGLAVGDALGEQFFGRADDIAGRVSTRQLPPPPWEFTDDTMMAASLVAILAAHGTVDEDVLAGSFAQHYDPDWSCPGLTDT